MTQGDVLSYWDMCRREGASLQRGMNFRMRASLSVILMSLRRDAPYADRVEEDGRVLIYEGHDAPRGHDGREPKTIDQPVRNPQGGLTQNGLFYEAAVRCKRGESEPELVKVYEKIRQGIWVFNGTFRLVDAWQETSHGRSVFKFRLELAEQSPPTVDLSERGIEHPRLIPALVKTEVWKRDKGRCAVCGSPDNLHFDHVIPYSKGGTSLDASNIQILCARHNLAKKDRIE